MSFWHKIAGVIFGLWLLAAPHTFGYQSFILSTSDWISGLTLIFLGPIFPIWIFGGVGLWLGAAPLVLWAPDAACYLNDTLVSALLFSCFLSRSGTFRSDPKSPSIPPGWSYNPSTLPQRFPVAFLAFVCWMISRYLAAYELGYIDTMWDPFFEDGTVRVLTSNVSHAFPVADAGLGAFAYTLEMFSALFGNDRRWRTMPWMVLIFGVLSVPVSLVSVLLIMLQPLVVGAWCTLCLLTAFCMLIAIPLALNEVVVTLHFLHGNWKALFQGGECREAKIDPTPVSLEGPLLPLIYEVKQGISAPWNLMVTSLLGASFMAIPGIFLFDGLLADLDHIFGALIIVASVIAFADVARKVRLVNICLVTPLIIAPFFSPEQPLLHWSLSILVLLFSLYRKSRKNQIFRA